MFAFIDGLICVDLQFAVRVTAQEVAASAARYAATIGENHIDYDAAIAASRLAAQAVDMIDEDARPVMTSSASHHVQLIADAAKFVVDAAKSLRAEDAIDARYRVQRAWVTFVHFERYNATPDEVEEGLRARLRKALAAV